MDQFFNHCGLECVALRNSASFRSSRNKGITQTNNKEYCKDTALPIYDSGFLFRLRIWDGSRCFFLLNCPNCFLRSSKKIIKQNFPERKSIVSSMKWAKSVYLHKELSLKLLELLCENRQEYSKGVPPLYHIEISEIICKRTE